MLALMFPLTPPSEDVYYQVEIINPNPCDPGKTYSTSRSNKTSNKYVGLIGPTTEIALQVYPNPFKEELMVKWQGSASIGQLATCRGKQ